ncbi:accessory Sec system protein Asp1 [Convivina praedatoris]|uniref:Accessory Sec system protein Asp1 n=1 Tax=Convivina praedatoris TaxID=2880963 RepID=A0ABM9D4N6_9LACO|nr:accessory Sec system protein Asp1 [Convivina sp. LMG 32447]CAH1854430.1 Accessory Sec system protein Asp1 [Convivina sp. LMG 32447]CAH1855648.1 Accessory Sec system protein Asp1 [Convivina sp. LMG 32447]CAH1855748.1 Accessory Sec system protein Asp1 [Convivina sp. LMG 32447]
MPIHMMPDWQRYLNQVPQMDAMVHQAKLFTLNKEAVELVVCDYLPKFRALLSQNGLENLSYWSAYDCLQNVNIKQQRPLGVHDFTWPSDAQFIRMYDRVLIMVKRQHYATIWPAYPSGDLFDRIDLMENDKLKQQLTLDDRGFVSRVVNFENDVVVRVDYLTPSGDIAVQENYQTGLVTTQQSWTGQKTFPNMNALIREVSVRYLKALSPEEILLVAQTGRNVEILDQLPAGYQIITTYNGDYAESTVQVPTNSQQIIASQPGEVPALQANSLVQVPLEVIAPFAAQLVLGRAAPHNKLPIFWTVNQVDEQLRHQIMRTLIQLAQEHRELNIVCESSQAVDDLRAIVAEAAQQMASQPGSMTADVQAFQDQFIFIPPQSEGQLFDWFHATYLLLDFGNRPNTYLQTLAISKGIPQLNRVATPYLVNGQNGQILQEPSQIIAVVNQYLEDWNYWMSIQTAAIRLSYEFDQQELWEKWQEVLKRARLGNKYGEK